MVKARLKDRKSFRENLARKGYVSLGDTAQLFGISYHTTQQMLSGKRHPTLKIAFKISQVMNVPFDELFEFVHRGDTDEPQT